MYHPIDWLIVTLFVLGWLSIGLTFAYGFFWFVGDDSIRVSLTSGLGGIVGIGLLFHSQRIAKEREKRR